MKGPPLGPCGEEITWPDQVAPGAERRLVPETPNFKPQTLIQSKYQFIIVGFTPCNRG